ncbi:MAG: hypothetical protein IPO92_18765 [Saprospiraceae bacterium]|nr:hypothetical protein [Saprospiraceae bacterium]
MKVTSLNADNKIEIKRNNTKLFDYNGGFSDATYLKISGKTEYNTVGGSDFTFTKGIAVPVEIVFENVSESDGVALLELNVNKGGYKVLKFKDINYDGVTYKKPIASTPALKTIEEDGFKFDLTNIKKTGERVTVFMKVTSLNADNKIEIKRNNTKLFDYNGGFSDATYLKISGKTEYNTVGK